MSQHRLSKLHCTVHESRMFKSLYTLPFIRCLFSFFALINYTTSDVPLDVNEWTATKCGGAAKINLGNKKQQWSFCVTCFLWCVARSAVLCLRVGMSSKVHFFGCVRFTTQLTVFQTELQRPKMKPEPSKNINEFNSYKNNQTRKYSLLLNYHGKKVVFVLHG